MAVIENKWKEKVKKKQEPEKAPAFEKNTIDEWDPVEAIKRKNYHSKSQHIVGVRTLRGIRK